jgi:hypothetical protein
MPSATSTVIRPVSSAAAAYLSLGREKQGRQDSAKTQEDD